MADDGQLRVAIDARLESGLSGGVEQVIIGLASGLSRLAPSSERYLLVVNRDSWPWVGAGVASESMARVRAGWNQPPRGIGRLRGQRWLPRPIRQFVSGAAEHQPGDVLPRSTGLVEKHRASVIHFTTQSGAFATDVPSIYQPHDLQHLHLPEFFSPAQVAQREQVYRAACEQAAAVVAMTRWGQLDLIDRYGLDPSRVIVVPWAATLPEYPEPTAEQVLRTRAKFALPEQFLLYPAQTWAHKNHLGLVRAIGCLKRQGIDIHVVCTGFKTSHHDAITKTIRREGVGDLVTFTGFVSPSALRAIYQMSRGIVFPTLFEGWGMPVLEAFSEGKPVACANVTMLPDLCAGAALLFDPRSDSSIAEAIERLWADEPLRRELASRGHVRGKAFSWETTARIFRAHYRRLGGGTLTADDVELLGAPPAL